MFLLEFQKTPEISKNDSFQILKKKPFDEHLILGLVVISV